MDNEFLEPTKKLVWGIFAIVLSSAVLAIILSKVFSVYSVQLFIESFNTMRASSPVLVYSLLALSGIMILVLGFGIRITIKQTKLLRNMMK